MNSIGQINQMNMTQMKAKNIRKIQSKHNPGIKIDDGETIPGCCMSCT